MPWDCDRLKGMWACDAPEALQVMGVLQASPCPVVNKQRHVFRRQWNGFGLQGQEQLRA
jgi:hypothetical protein